MANATQSIEMNYLAPPVNTYKAPGRQNRVQTERSGNRMNDAIPASYQSPIVRMAASDIRQASHSRHLNENPAPFSGTNLPAIRVSNFDRERLQTQGFEQADRLERGKGVSEINRASKPKKLIKFNAAFFINTGAIILTTLVLGLLLPGMFKSYQE